MKLFNWRYAFLASVLSTTSLWAVNPTWWTTRAALNSNSADDYAAANVGQLKALFTKATIEINLRLQGGAGSTINSLVDGWAQPSVTDRDDYAALNQGQLKCMAKIIYDKLGLSYPWSTPTSDDDDYAIVNLGQLKYVFNFPIAATGDSDADGLPDSWEIAQFGGTVFQFGSGNAEAMPDALSNRAEYLVSSNPNTRATDVTTSGTLALVVFSP